MASDATVFRLIQKIAADPELVQALRSAHAQARVRFWELAGAPERLTIDIDATLINSHSDKEDRQTDHDLRQIRNRRQSLI